MVFGPQQKIKNHDFPAQGLEVRFLDSWCDFLWNSAIPVVVRAFWGDFGPKHVSTKIHFVNVVKIMVFYVSGD